MDALWKWMVRANARAVLFSGLALFALLVSFLTWREFHPAGADAPPPPSRPRPVAEAGLGLRDFVAAVSAAPAAPAGNPFLNPRPDRPPVARVPPPRAPEPVPAPPPRAPPAAPRREMIRLVYRGLYQTDEDAPRALIEDSKRRRSSFYRVGEVLFGMKIRDIRMLEVSLLPAGGSDVTLKLGEPYEFEERPNGY